MPFDNQTLTEIVRNAIETSIKPDYTGWTLGIVGVIIGIVGIIITIVIYDKQTKLTDEFKKLRKDSILSALERIEQNLIFCKDTIVKQMNFVENANLSMDDRIVVARELMKDTRDSRTYIANTIIKEADFVRLGVKPELYNNIQIIAREIRIFVSDEILYVGSSDPKYVFGTWLKCGYGIINATDIVIPQLTLDIQQRDVQ